MRTLYFEGAGWADADISKATVGNCRIRTAFHTDSGNAIYLEMSACEVTKHSASYIKHLRYAGFVTDCFYLTGDSNDCNKHSIHNRNDVAFEYNEENILQFVNSLGCSFDAIVILPDLAGYRVFGDGESYNFGDAFQYSEELTNRAQDVHDHFYALEKSEGKEYPNFSLWVDAKDRNLLHLMRHFNGYNLHWTVTNSADWMNTITEATLGKYAC